MYVCCMYKCIDVTTLFSHENASRLGYAIIFYSLFNYKTAVPPLDGVCVF